MKDQKNEQKKCSVLMIVAKAVHITWVSSSFVSCVNEKKSLRKRGFVLLAIIILSMIQSRWSFPIQWRQNEGTRKAEQDGSGMILLHHHIIQDDHDDGDTRKLTDIYTIISVTFFRSLQKVVLLKIPFIYFIIISCVLATFFRDWIKQCVMWRMLKREVLLSLRKKR